MALQKQKIPVPFIAGIDTKTDNKQLQVGSLSVAENIAFENPGKIKKSNGYESIPLYSLNGTKLENLKSLASYKDELDVLTNQSFYANSANFNKWIYKGKIVDSSIKSSIVLRNEKEQINQDCIYLENTKVFVYEDSEGLKYSVIDRVNGTTIVNNIIVSATGTKGRLAHTGTSVVIIYAETTDIVYKSFDVLNPQNLSSAVALTNDLDSNNNFDIASTSNGRITVVYNSTGNIIKLFQILSNFVVTSIASKGTEDASVTLDLNVDYMDRIIVTYYNGTEVKLFMLRSNLSVDVIPPTVIDTVANVINTTAQFNNGRILVHYEISALSGDNNFIKQNTIDLAATVGTPTIYLRSVGLAAKTFVANNLIYVLTVHSSTLQPTYFVADEAGSVVNIISLSLGGSLINSALLPHIASIDSNTYLIVTQVKGRIITESGSFDSLLGINSTELVFNTENSTGKQILADNLHLPSGILYMYDGNQVVEHGFFLYPENFTHTTLTAGGSLSDGIYQYAAVYNWTDAKGQQHLSAPSVPYNVTLSGGTSTQVVRVSVPTLRLTDKSNIVIDLYRTEASGTIFYKVTSVSAPVLNDPTVDSVTVIDTISDSSLISQETLYSTGGVLDNIIAPQATIITSLKERIFLAGLEDENKIQYSKIVSEGRPVEFNDTLTVNVNPFGGPITSLHAMDDKLIIFKERAIYYMSGDGPNNLGEQDSFITPELISSDMGCVNRDSVVLTSQGVLFQSKKGIYQLGRDLNIQYIGAPVESFNNLTITSADIVNNKNIIRFVTKEGTTLVYNYFVGQWATYTNQPAIDSEIVKGEYYYLRSSTSIYKENDSYTNNGTDIKLKVVTGWLSFAGIQGFQRAYRVHILGDFKSDHKLRIKVAYDYKEVFVQESIISASDFIDSSAYGNTTPYGSDTIYGGDGNLYQIRLDFAIQKCQSIKISIEDITEDSGEALSLSSMSFLVGSLAAPASLNKGNTYGTN